MDLAVTFGAVGCTEALTSLVETADSDAADMRGAVPSGAGGT
jgi:hypothetical protein